MEAYVYDHVRTPRGKGRPDGALHEVTSVEMATQLLQALQQRNDLDTSLLDDVIIGMAQPVGEQGGVLARAAVLQAGYAQTVGGQQIHRFCATGLDAVSLIAAQVHAGMIQAGIGGGVESMSRTVMGYDSGAWTSDPAVAYQNHYAPQGIGADMIATLDGY
ncbi:MAG: acetyl-CoA C-acyltransferase, partial [Novosphingobium sp.]